LSRIHLTDEILMAFADGELDETVRRAVEEAMAHDSELRQRVAGYVRSRRLAQTALSTDDYLAVPSALRAHVMRQVSAAEKPSESAETATKQISRENSSAVFARSRPTQYMLPLAASVAALAIGIGMFFAGRWTGSDEFASQSLVARLASPQVQAALSTTASGQPQSVEAGQMRVIATYKSGSGALCREFTLQDASGKANAVACRSKSDWNITFALVEPTQASGYSPADGGNLISSYLQGLNAGDPLEPSLEKKALSVSE
jgi:anti-sigma-K factor RskA